MADDEPQTPPMAGRKLQVANAKKEDSGRGLARLSRQVMASLGLVQGDIVEIEGKRARWIPMLKMKDWRSSVSMVSFASTPA